MSAEPRKAIFDAVRNAAPKGLFNDPGNVLALDNLLDAFNVPRDGEIVVTAGDWTTLAIPLMHEFEGYAKDIGGGRVQAYPDPATGGAPWTIGYGSTGPEIVKGTVWTKAQAQARFQRDLEHFANGVEHALAGAKTTNAQFAAMVSLAYNVGLANFRSSTLLKKHKAGDFVGAKAEFARWNRAAGKVMAGLTRRRAAEASLYGGAA